jgi:hypothetical protein
MTQPKETAMDTNEKARSNDSDIIELGIASVETMGRPGVTEITGDLPMAGISED